MEYSIAAETAGRMLGCDAGQMHSGFIAYLDKIDGLACRDGGQIFSRQVVAMAIVNWELITGLVITD